MPADVSFRAPTDRDRGSADYLGLLASASGRTGSALQSLAVDVRGGLTTIVAFVDGRLVGLASYEAGTTGTVLRHLAVEHGHRGAGLGRRLVTSVREAVQGAPLLAETDDDAVAFYRRTGFAVTALPRDPRRPHVQRYRCVLAADAR
ncbi:GNAT family N-acetyltransferase [Oerskovia sp. NPDC060287]|uniref:GNAT family N-acetyltransferase n=1 Tax=Oerskovia sp. NPDC060287 TaxID=3347095 RepID=UPI0036619207